MLWNLTSQLQRKSRRKKKTLTEARGGKNTAEGCRFACCHSLKEGEMPKGCHNAKMPGMWPTLCYSGERKKTPLEQNCPVIQWNGLNVKKSTFPNFSFATVSFLCCFSQTCQSRVKKKCPYLFSTSNCCWGMYVVVMANKQRRHNCRIFLGLRSIIRIVTQ